MELKSDCDCMEEHCRVGAFEVSEVWSGSEQELAVRIDLWRCMECHRYWLRYSQVDEASPAVQGFGDDVPAFMHLRPRVVSKQRESKA